MALEYVDGQLVLKKNDKVWNFSDLVKDRDEPLYVYDLEGMRERLKVYLEHFSCNIKVHYAVKANNHPEILNLFAKEGIGADVVSGGELKQALKAGFAANKIIFSGVGKSKNEIRLAIKNRIKQINVESPQELQRIGQLADELGEDVSVAWRMNPDVNPDTHPYITTGFRENKFGMDNSFIPELKKIMEHFPRLRLRGLTLHIGSQIRDTRPFIEAIQKTKAVYEALLRDGYELSTFDIGGGLGINYDKQDLKSDDDLIQTYGQLVSELFSNFKGEVLCEPGRALVGSFGYLLGQVQYIKTTPYKNFAIINTGMHHLIRPMLYQAHHTIYALRAASSNGQKIYDVVGPICESADVLGKDRLLPELNQEDWLMIADVGAYGRVMASHYNSHPLPEEKIL